MEKQGSFFFINVLLLLIIPWTCINSQTIGLKLASGTGEGCAPLTVNFVNTSSFAGFSGFWWDWNNDGIGDSLCGPDNAGLQISHVFTSPQLGSYVNLIGIVASGPPPKASYPISVWGINSPSLSLSAADVCSDPVTLTNTSALADNGINHLTMWDFGDGSTSVWSPSLTLTHVYNNSGTFKITLTDQNQCGIDSATSQINVTILDPLIECSSGTTVCQGETITFSNKSLVPANVTYLWDFGDGISSTSSNPEHRYINPGDFNVWLYMDLDNPSISGCKDSSMFSIHVNPGPIAEFTSSIPLKCDSSYVSFSDLSIIDKIVDSYSWISGLGDTISVSQLPDSVFYDSTGYFYPCLRISRSTNGCVSEYNDTILVPKTPVVHFLADRVCLNQETQFADSTYGGIPANYTYLWNFDDGNTSNLQNPLHIYTTPGLKNVILQVTNGCPAEMTKTIVVEDLPHPFFELNTYKGCSKLNIVTDNQTPDGANYIWRFGNLTSLTARDTSYTIDNSTGQDIMVDVKLITTTAFGCIDSISRPVKVFQTPIALFSSDIQPVPVCVPDTVTFTSLTTGNPALEWDFGDNTTAADSIAIHIYENEEHYFRYYMMNLVARSDSGCTDTAYQYITLYPKPNTDFVMDTLPSTCSPASVLFTAPAEYQGAFTWVFEPGDTLKTTDNHATYEFSNTGTTDQVFPVTLITKNQFGCLGDTIENLIVHASPSALFTMNPNPDTLPRPVNFAITTPNNPGWDYRWILDIPAIDNSVYNPGPLIFDSFNDIQVMFIVTTQYGCSDTLLDLLDIVPPPPFLDFIPDTLSGCPELTVSFRDSSKYTDTTTYVWDFDDGTHSYEVNPVHTFLDGGNKTVRLTAKGLDGSDLLKDTVIQVFGMPSAAFNITPEIAWVPDNPVLCSPVYKSNTWLYSWNFGDGETSDSMEVVHYYKDTTSTGQFEITLNVVTEDNCTDMASKTIMAKTSGKIESPNVFFPGGGGTGDGGGLIGDGNSVFAPVTEGVVEYHLEVYDRWGERLFNSDSKEIGWTGYYHGRLCKEDVYVWKVFGKYANNVKFIKAGTITLLHK